MLLSAYLLDVGSSSTAGAKSIRLSRQRMLTSTKVQRAM